MLRGREVRLSQACSLASSTPSARIDELDEDDEEKDDDEPGGGVYGISLDNQYTIDNGGVTVSPVA